MLTNMMKPIKELFSEYAESHQNKVNKAIHWICVPAIFFSLVCLLLEVRIGAYFSLASVIMVFVVLFFLRLSPPFAAGMVFLFIICLAIAKALVLSGFVLWKTGLIIFILAWIGQFIGHKIEGKKPSFLTDLKFLLIGPAWLMSFIFNRLGVKY